MSVDPSSSSPSVPSDARPLSSKRNIAFKIPKLSSEQIEKAAATEAQAPKAEDEKSVTVSSSKPSGRHVRPYTSAPYTNPDTKCPNIFGVTLLQLTNPKDFSSSTWSWSESQQRSLECALRSPSVTRALPESKWIEVSKFVTGRTPEECSTRFLEVEHSNIIRSQSLHFLSLMGQHCKIHQFAIATASVYFHVFFSRLSFKLYDRFEVAACCLFLAGKVEERRTRVDQVIEAYYIVRQKYSPDRRYQPTPERVEAMRQKMYSLEFELLDAIEFNFEVKHPYAHLMIYIKEKIYGPDYANAPADWLAKETSERGGLAQVAWLFTNDSLRSTLCLRYPPQVVIVGVIALSIQSRKFPEPVRAGTTPGSARPWHDELFGVDKETVNVIMDTLLTLNEDRRYILPQVNPSPARQQQQATRPPGHAAANTPNARTPAKPATAPASAADLNKKRGRGPTESGPPASAAPASANPRQPIARPHAPAISSAPSAPPTRPVASSHRQRPPQQSSFAPLGGAARPQAAKPGGRPQRPSQPQFSSFSSSMPSLLTSLHQSISVSTAELTMSLEESKLNVTYSPSQSISALISSPSLSKGTPGQSTDDKNLSSTPMRLLADMDKMRDGLKAQDDSEVMADLGRFSEEAAAERERRRAGEDDDPIQPVWKRSRHHERESLDAAADDSAQFDSFDAAAFDEPAERESRSTSASPSNEHEPDQHEQPEHDDSHAHGDGDGDLSHHEAMSPRDPNSVPLDELMRDDAEENPQQTDNADAGAADGAGAVDGKFAGEARASPTGNLTAPGDSMAS